MSVRRALCIIAAIALALVGACGGDGPDEAAGGTEPADAVTTAPDPLATLAEPEPGHGVARIGVDELAFSVDDCESGPAEGDTPEATQELRVTGHGETDGEAFTVEITRFRSDSGVGAPVVTETATITVGTGEEARGLAPRRSTAGPGGAWLDLADPEADDPLLDRTGDAVDVQGTFGVDGATAADPGLAPGRIRVRCPQ